MADIDYRLGIENATVHAELAPSEEVAQLWQHIRENYEYLLMFDELSPKQAQLSSEICP